MFVFVGLAAVGGGVEPWTGASELEASPVLDSPTTGLVTYSRCEVSSPFKFSRQTGQVPCYVKQEKRIKNVINL